MIMHAREHLAAATRRSRDHDDDDEPTSLAPASLARAPLAPGKRPGATADLDAVDATAATRPDGFDAWKTRAQIDRRADVELDDEDGALVTAFGLLEQTRGGQPLPDALRARLEAELGVSLAAVRLHTDAAAAAAAVALGARAFTMGDDIYFAPGAYEPHGEAGRALIAHEVAHVAQQRRGAAPTDHKVSRPTDAHERDADRFAQRFARDSVTRGDDPARIVDYARREGRRVELPFVDEIERELGTSLGFVEAFTGDAAQLACQALSATAFAIQNIVVLADPTPQREQLLHELAHVVQMGKRTAPATFALGSLTVSDPGDHAEVEARGGGPVHATASPTTIHRDDGTPAAPIDNAEARRRRIEMFVGVKHSECIQLPIAATVEGHAVQGFRYFDPGSRTPYAHASESSFTLDAYVQMFSNPTDVALKANYGQCQEDLTQLVAAGATHRIARVIPGGTLGTPAPAGGSGGRTYVFILDGSWVADVVDIRPDRSPPPTPAQSHAVYVDAVDKLIAVGRLGAAPFTYANGTATSGHKVVCVDAAAVEAYRVAMRAAMVAAYVAAGDTGWDDFYREVMVARIFPAAYNGVVGSTFEELVAATVGVSLAPQRPLFRSTHFASTKLRIGDGSFAIANERHAIMDAKAAVAGIALDQADDYNKITDPTKQIYGYFQGEDPSTTRREYRAVVYTVPSAPIASTVKQQLINRFPAQRATLWNKFFIEPPPEGMKSFRILFNPTVTLQAEDTGESSYSFTNPQSLLPGVNIASAQVGLGTDGQMTSGTVNLGVDMGGAITNDPVAKPITPEGAAGAAPTGRVDNRFAGFRSSLDQVLSAVTVDARLIDGGVEGTITLNPGAISIPSFTIDAAVLTARYTEAGLAITGSVAVAHTSGKIRGSVTVGWTNGAWSFDGTATLQEGLIDGLSEVTLTVHHENSQTRIECAEASYQKTIGQIAITGSVTGLRYDVATAAFSGGAQLTADLGMFGNAQAEATFENNALTRASFSYDSPEFAYPKDAASPSFTGSVGGTVTYADGAFSGAIRGAANVNVAALRAIAGDAGIGLEVAATINADGTYGGTIGTTTPLLFGRHLRIPSLACTIAPDGALSGAFSVEVIGIRYLDRVAVACTVDGTGIHIQDASVEAAFGTPETQGSFWGTLRVGYAEATGLSIGGDVNYQIKPGMVATGTMTYDAAAQAVSLSMTVSEFKLLESTMSRTLFSASKQIPVFNFAGIGVYLDLGFDLGFDFGFDLGIRPTVAFEGLQLDTFEFTRISAQLTLLGDIYARLTGTPRLGLGIFALSPSLLRGGGGVRIPIVGEARITPTGTISVGYTPSGGLESAASIGMAMSFGITGSVIPYAELSVLDGMWNPSWTGDALTSFELLPPRELFNINIDLGGDLTPREPELPAANAAAPPTGSTATTVLPQVDSAPTERSGPAASNTTEGPTAAPSEAGDEGPFSLAALAPMLDGLPGVAPIKAILQKAGEVWGAISGFFGRVMTAFRSYFAALADQLLEILDGFAQQGLGYLPTLIRKIIGDTAYEIVEPLVTYFAGIGQDLIDLFTTSPPTDLANLMPWVWQLVGRIVNLSGDLWGFVGAIGQMLGNLGDFTRRLVNRAVTDGWIGVKRHHYYIWAPWPFDNYNFLAAAEYKVHIPNVMQIGEGPPGILLTPGAAVAIGLYEMLGSMGVPVTHAGWCDGVGEPYNDRWTGAGARG